MTSYSPRIYIYKITFKEVPYYYYGVHKEDVFDQEYWGSPYTHKWVWEFYTPKKQILEVFPYTDDGWIEGNKVEKRIIKEFYNDDKWCLNENCAGIFSINHQKIAGLKGGEKTKENNVGIFALSKDERLKNSSRGGITSGNNHKKNKTGLCGISPKQRSENGKKGAKINEKNGTGFYGMSVEQRSENGKKAAETHKKNGTGIYAFTPEERTKNGKKGGSIGGKIGGKIAGKKCKELGIGIYAIPTEKRRETGKKVCSQKWECTETGFTTNAGNLAKYQKARGIDTSKRRKIS